jgi:hypothetical protein
MKWAAIDLASKPSSRTILGGCFVDSYHWRKGIGRVCEPYGDDRWGNYRDHKRPRYLDCMLLTETADAFNDVEHPDSVQLEETALTCTNSRVEPPPRSLAIMRVATPARTPTPRRKRKKRREPPDTGMLPASRLASDKWIVPDLFGFGCSMPVH